LVELAGRGETAPNVVAALEMVRLRGAQEDISEDAVVITGSLFLAGEARALFQNPGRAENIQRLEDARKRA
jgi:folylpolyglutamate synthase/dihydropteroate synthase